MSSLELYFNLYLIGILLGFGIVLEGKSNKKKINISHCFLSWVLVGALLANILIELEKINEKGE